MLRNDCLTALNDVLVACRESVDRYHDNASLLSDPELARQCRDWADRRRTQCDALADDIRYLGALPDEPDVDRETFHSAATHLKARFARDTQATVLADCEHSDHDLEERIATALRNRPPEHVQQRLERLLSEVETVREALLRHMARASDTK